MSNSQELACLRAENEALKTRIRHLALEHSILNDLDYPADLKTLAEYYQCEFHSDYLILAVIHAQANPLCRHNSPVAELMQPDIPKSDLELPPLYYPEDALCRVEEICINTFAPQTQCIIFRAKQNIGVLLNPHNKYIASINIESGNYYEEVLMRLNVAIHQMNAALDFQNVAAVSSLHFKKISLRKMYLETKHTFDYSWNLNGAVFSYPKLFSTPDEVSAHMALSALEIEFLNDINRLLFFEASVVLDQILEMQFRSAVPLEEVTIAVTARLRNVIAVLQATNSLMPEDVEELLSLVSLVTASGSVPELTDRCHDLFSFLSEKSPRDSIRKSTQIIEFIQSNYKDSALSAQLICDRFRISPTYLSRLIKAETGGGLLDLVHTTRVNHAKPLLADTNLSIEQVALQVGFNNRHGLIRAFRAVEGTTPSEYRKQLQTPCPCE